MADYRSVPAAYRFVGGRRHYNRQRREAAEARRRRLLDLICAAEEKPYQRQLARALGVHEATVSRDLAILSPNMYWWFYLPMARLLNRRAIKAAVALRWQTAPVRAIEPSAPKAAPAPPRVVAVVRPEPVPIALSR